MLVRHAVCRYLEERDFQIESATNGVEALAILNRVIPDLIITDMQMPKMSGPELIQKVQQNPRTADIPIVILSSLKSGRDPADAQLKVADRICKDIDIDAQLEKALRTALKT